MAFENAWEHGNQIQPNGLNQVVQVVFSGSAFHFDCASCYQTRGDSCVKLIKQAIEQIDVGKLKPFMFVIYTGDYIENYPISFSGPEYTDYLVPDFNFWAWPEVGIDDYEDTCNQMLEASKTRPEYDKLFWAGNTNTNIARKKFKEMTKNDERILVDDVGDWHVDDLETWFSPSKKRLKTASGTFTSLPDHCKYKYLIDFLGNGYSGRVKHLLHSGRPIFYQERYWNEYWFFDMEPFVHYIPVKNDLSDFYEQFEWAQTNDDECQKIAKQAQDFAKQNLRRSNAVERYRDIIYMVGT